MIPSALFARYSRSLAQVVMENNEEPAVTGDLMMYREIFESVPDLAIALDNPAVPRETKESILAHLFAQYPVSGTTANFLRILLEHNRLRYFREICESYVKTVNERKGIVAARVMVATPLSAQEYSRLQASLANITGRKVTLGVQTEPDLLGGLVVQIGSTVYDGSIRRHLTEMKERLKGA